VELGHVEEDEPIEPGESSTVSVFSDEPNAHVY
jgi:hypothetical protein